MYFYQYCLLVRTFCLNTANLYFWKINFQSLSVYFYLIIHFVIWEIFDKFFINSVNFMNPSVLYIQLIWHKSVAQVCQTRALQAACYLLIIFLQPMGSHYCNQYFPQILMFNIFVLHWLPCQQMGSHNEQVVQNNQPTTLWCCKR